MGVGDGSTTRIYSLQLQLAARSIIIIHNTKVPHKQPVQIPLLHTMRLHFNAYLATALVISSSLYHVTADSTTTSIRGTRSASQTSSMEENLLTSNTRFLIPKERRLLPHEGVMRTIIIRVTDGEGKQPITDARRESDTWFGTHGLALAGNLNSLVRMISYQCLTSVALFPFTNLQ